MFPRALWAITPLFIAIGCGSEPEPENTGICGTWSESSVDFEATVWNPQLDEPVEGAELLCEGEDTPRATSDADGVL
jgi:hypothetical protein